jgi:cholesterol transport system auxiliary component
LQGEGLQDSSGKKLAQVSTERLDAKLLVRNVEANIFIDSHKIVFSESPMTRGYYQFAQWVEPPPKQISTLLVEYLTSLGLFDSVTRVSSLTKGDLQLNLWLREFHHDISEEPGFVVIRLEAELLDVQGRSALSRTEFVVKEAVETYDAVGAVSGFDRGLAQIFDQIGIWLNKELKTI